MICFIAWRKDFFEEIPDSRQDWNVPHGIDEILTVVMCGREHGARDPRVRGNKGRPAERKGGAEASERASVPRHDKKGSGNDRPESLPWAFHKAN